MIGNQLIINTSTAWSPMMQMWKLVLDKYLPDAELIYEAEECGCEIYWTNDPAMKGNYIFDAFDCPDINSDWEMPESILIKELQGLLLTSQNNIKELLDEFYKSDLTDSISIHKWEFVGVDELE